MGAALGCRAAGLAISLLLNLVLGRALGAHGVGVYYVFIAWTHVIGTLVGLGLPLAVTRIVARLERDGCSAQARASTLRALGAIGGIGAAATGVALLVGDALATALLGSAAVLSLLHAAAPAGAATALLRTVAEALKARGRPLLALTAEFTAVPAALLLLFAGFLASGAALTAGTVLWAYVAAAAAASAVAGWTLFHGWRVRQGRPARVPARATGLWGADLLSIALYYLPFLVLPHVASSGDLGRFGLAHRLVAPSLIILGVLASLFAPEFARLHAAGDRAGLRRSLRASQAYAVVAYAPLLAAFAFFGRELLAVFGRDFASATTVLWILAAGQLVQTAVGSSGHVLYMTGRERWDVAAQVAALALGGLLALALGARWGAIGVAAACAATTALRSGAVYCLARRAIRESPHAAPRPTPYDQPELARA